MFAITLAEGAELRPLEPWHAAELFDAVDGAREHLRPWVPLAGNVVDIPSAQAVLQSYADRQALDTARSCGIWLHDVLVGGVVFKDFNTGMGTCEVGVWLTPEGEGRGLIHKAVRHMLGWAIEQRGMARIEWRCDPANKRSVAAAERLGFVYEGIMRNEWILNGKRSDSALYSMTDKDWSAIRSTAV